MIFDGQYLTYAEYQSLGGTLDEVPFNIMELTARGILNERTHNRLKSLETQINEVKICMFELIDNMPSITSPKNVSSESIDGYSVSYTQKTTIEQQKLYDEIIRSNLMMCQLDDGTPYLYCGVG